MIVLPLQLLQIEWHTIIHFDPFSEYGDEQAVTHVFSYNRAGVVVPVVSQLLQFVAESAQVKHFERSQDVQTGFDGDDKFPN
jgi:hypothetical protein